LLKDLEEDRREIGRSQEFWRRPRKWGGRKEEELPKGEDYVCLESGLSSDNKNAYQKPEI
jgi:hypothetical protein